MSEPTITLEAAAAYLGMAPSTLRKRAAAGAVNAHKVGGRWLLSRREVARLLRAGKPKKPTWRQLRAAAERMSRWRRKP